MKTVLEKNKTSDLLVTWKFKNNLAKFIFDVKNLIIKIFDIVVYTTVSAIQDVQ